MKKLFLIFAPLVLAGCDAQNDSVSASPNDNQTQEVAAVQQTVYQYQVVQPATQDLVSLSKSSNEYWQTVTGRELKEGVEVFLTTDDNLIRLAPKNRYEDGEVFQAAGITLEDLELQGQSRSQKSSFAITQKANQKEMQLAGFDDGSVAINASTNGKNAILKTRQALRDDANYLIHVKEKNSDYVLNTESGFKKPLGENRLPMALNINGQEIAGNHTTVKLLSPTNESVAVNYTNNGVEFMQPLEQIGAINGFYEIEATVLAEVNGKRVKRSVKMPFTNVLETAQLGQHSITKLPSAGEAEVNVKIPVDVMMPGQYAVKATLAVKTGDTVTKLATVEAAQKLSYSGTIQLPFSISDMPKGELFITDVEVTDQSRMIKMFPKL